MFFLVSRQKWTEWMKSGLHTDSMLFRLYPSTSKEYSNFENEQKKKKKKNTHRKKKQSVDDEASMQCVECSISHIEFSSKLSYRLVVDRVYMYIHIYAMNRESECEWMWKSTQNFCCLNDDDIPMYMCMESCTGYAMLHIHSTYGIFFFFFIWKIERSTNMCMLLHLLLANNRFIIIIFRSCYTFRKIRI